MEEAKGITDELRRQLVLKGKRPENFIVSGRKGSPGKRQMEMLRLIPRYSLPCPTIFGSAIKLQTSAAIV